MEVATAGDKLRFPQHIGLVGFYRRFTSWQHLRSYQDGPFAYACVYGWFVPQAVTLRQMWHHSLIVVQRSMKKGSIIVFKFKCFFFVLGVCAREGMYAGDGLDRTR